MRFCTRAQMLGVLATLAFLAALVFPVHSALAKQKSTQTSEQSEAVKRNQSDKSLEHNRSDNLDELLRLLDRPAEFDFFETPLDEVVDGLSDQHAIDVMFDVAALEDLSIDLQEIVTFELSDSSLGTGLDLMLSKYDLGYYLHDNVLVITSVERLENELYAHVYNVRDLLNAERPWQSIDMLMEVIVGSIESDSWDELGGPASIHSYQGNLIISQTWRQHREIGRLLNTLRTNIQAMGGPNLPLRPPVSPQQAAGGGSGGVDVGGSLGGGGGFGGGSAGGGGGGFFRVGDNASGKEEANTEPDPFDAGDESEDGIDPFGNSDPFAEPKENNKPQEKSLQVGDAQCQVRGDQTEIRTIDLQRRITLDFKNAPLSEAMDAIAEQGKFSWKVDKNALEEVAVDSSEPITFHAQNVTLETALKMMLGDLELSYLLIDDSFLLLTTEERVAAELTTRYYNARPLLRSRDPEVSLDQLIELMIATVEPDSWEKLGGAGASGQYEGILVIANTPFIHTKVAAFLNDLGKALAEAGGVELAKPETFGRRETGGGRRTRR